MRTYRLIPLLAITLLFSACTKEYVTKEYITEQTVIQGAEMTFVDITVDSKDWKDMGGYLKAAKKVDQITKAVFDAGHVQVSACMFDSNNVMTWTPLPMMRVSMTQLDGNDFYYTTYTDYEWEAGYVYIYVTTTDLYTGDNPGTCSFRVFITMNS